MFSITNIKNRFISAIAPDMPPLPSPSSHQLLRSGMPNTASSFQLRLAHQQQMPDKFTYARPPFLQLLTIDELRASADHNVRPIIVPRDINLLPWGTGYAECVNSGKSEWNEDQAAFCRQVLSDPSHVHPDLPYTYYGVFDGHAGYGAALAASHQFHHILHEKLVDCLDLLLPRDDEVPTIKSSHSFPHPSHFQRRVSKDELIIGALESAFFNMDALIAQDRDRYRDAGGCTACVSLFINGKLFVANAGDSRAVWCQRKSCTATALRLNSAEQEDVLSIVNECDLQGIYATPLSFDHTPETERPRLLTVARLKPHLMEKQYAAMEYAKRPHMKDLGQRILCRQGTMKGWTYKTLTRDDLRMPVVSGEGKRSRLLGTLGVTRGFGDHDLLAINTGTQIKPFLTPHPDVNIRDLSKIVSIPDENNEDGDYGIMVMATDGLWDVSENDAVARTVFQTLAKYPTEKHRYTMVAQELVARARGKINDSGHWRLADSKAAATVDDISVIVIPVYQYYKEHIEWEKNCAQEFCKRQLQLQQNQQQQQQAKEPQNATEAKENESVESLLMNGLTRSQIDIENDEDEEEIVVEVNRAQVEAKIEVEDDAGQVASKTPAELNYELPSSSLHNLDVSTEKDVSELIDTELTAAISALDAIESADTETNIVSSNSTPEKTFKSKPPAQHNRNRHRKDKR